MERRELGRSGISVTRIVLGCGNFGGVGSAPALFGQGISREEAPRIMDAAWDLGITTFDTADAYGGGRSESLDRRVARDEGLSCQGRGHDRDEDVQPHGRGRRPRPVAASDHAASSRRAWSAWASNVLRSTWRTRPTTRRPSRRRCPPSTRSCERGRSAPSARPTSPRSSSRSRWRSPSSRASRATSGCRTRSRCSTRATPTRCSRSVASAGSDSRRTAGSRGAGSPGATGAARATRRDRA